MINIVWDPGFKKAYQKKIKTDDNLKKKFWKTMKLFSSNPFSKQLRTHKLTGTLKGLWAFSVDYDTRVIFFSFFLQMTKYCSSILAAMTKCID